MKIYRLIMALVWSNVWFIRCAPRRKKTDTTQKFHRTGEAIAMDSLIRDYEREHQEFCTEKTKHGGCLQWPALNNKTLSNYCRKYLQHSMPGRNIDNATGIEIKRILHYEKENTSITHNVAIIQCKIVYKSHQLVCYMTRAPEPNCVYALKSTKNRSKLILSIIHKHCDFENKPFHRYSKKRWVEIVSKIHQRTGQPIAEDNYLRTYELEHEEMLRREGKKDKYYEWPFAIVHTNLNDYCYQYIGECVPERNRDSITGIWKTENLLYQKLDTNMEIRVIIITCKTFTKVKRQYHITRAPETNCVYALLRMGRGLRKPMVIIFKHCNFENSKDQQYSSQCNLILDENMMPKTEMKVEMSYTLEPLQLFPKN